MTVTELYKHLDSLFPSSLSCAWDNDGLMCCPDSSREVKRALVCLDVTVDAVKQAISGGYDVIVSHHPFIFKGLKSINEDSFIPSKAIELIKADISVMSFHTRLDAVLGGVNDTLAELLGLLDVSPFGEGIGRIGTLAQTTDVRSFAQKVKKTLVAPSVSLSDASRPVLRVAVLGGSGKDELWAAIAAGADTFVSGELGYHTLTDAPDMGINLIEAGHFYTEDPICEMLCQKLRELSIVADKYNSNRTSVI